MLRLRKLWTQTTCRYFAPGTKLAVVGGMLSLKKLLLTTALLAASACTGGGGEDSSKLRQLSHGPSLPAECDICWVDFEACAEAGNDIEVCEDAVLDCSLLCDAPPPPDTCVHCFAGYEACVEQAGDGIQDVSDCVAGLQSCLTSCEVTDPCLDGYSGSDLWCPPPPPPPTTCEDLCIEQCYFEPRPGEGTDGDTLPPVDSCVEECILECSDPEPCMTECWECPEGAEDCVGGCTTTCEPPPPEPCTEVCWICADGDDCEPGCTTNCEPPPEPCTEVCWDCADGDDCEPGCTTNCEPSPEPCVGACVEVCEAGDCEIVCDQGCGGPTEPAEPSTRA